jgi:3-methyladenine DNA glycosylase AlkD
MLEDNKSERGIENWLKLEDTNGLKSFGIGLTKLRVLAKKIGRNHTLSQELWKSDIYDAKTIALLIDEPKKITREQAERQVEQLDVGLLTHVFSSCDATLAKSPLAFEIANSWLATNHDLRRRSGYGLLYELSKNKRNMKLTDEYFLQCISDIEEKLLAPNETPTMRMAMGGALMGIGKRNAVLNKRATKVAKACGPIDFNEGDKRCEPFDLLKHLTNKTLLKKLYP